MTHHARPDAGTPLIVIPAWNEQETVGDVVADLTDHGLPCVVVDDGSTDDTRRVARAAGAEVVSLPLNGGVGAALRAGFRFAVERGFTAAVQCDADGQHEPAEIARLIDAANETGAHLVVGSRFADGGSYDHEVEALRRWAMRLLASRASQATRTAIGDATSGFRLIRDPLLHAFADRYPAQYLGDTFEALLMAGRAGYTVTEVPVRMHARQGGVPSSSALGSARFLTRTLLAVTVGATPSIPPPIGDPAPVRMPRETVISSTDSRTPRLDTPPRRAD